MHRSNVCVKLNSELIEKLENCAIQLYFYDVYLTSIPIVNKASNGLTEFSFQLETSILPDHNAKWYVMISYIYQCARRADQDQNPSDAILDRVRLECHVHNC